MLHVGKAYRTRVEAAWTACELWASSWTRATQAAVTCTSAVAPSWTNFSKLPSKPPLKDGVLLILTVPPFRSGGALGSRLTGAGWGGCVVSLVHESAAKEFVEYLHQNFYKKTPERDAAVGTSLFISPPAGGAEVKVL